MSGCCCVGPRVVVGGPAPEPPEPVHGFESLQDLLDLQPTPSGTWTDSTLEVTLPEAGTYQLDALVRAALSGAPPINTFITARLLDVTAGAPVPDSEVIVVQRNTAANGGDNDSAPIAVEYTVAGPTVIRLQAQRTNAAGTTTGARVLSNVSGRTTLRYLRIARV